MLTFVASLFGLIVGAFLQYYLGIIRSRKDAAQNLQIQAYTDFIKALAESHFARLRNDQASHSQALAHLVDAKTRICVNGDAKVISAIADFWRMGAKLDTDENIRIFLSIIRSMRSISRSQGEVSDDDLKAALFSSSE